MIEYSTSTDPVEYRHREAPDTRLWLDFPFLMRTGPSQRGRRVSDLYTTRLSSSANILSTTLSSLLPHLTSSTPHTTTQPDTLTKSTNSPHPRPPTTPRPYPPPVSYDQH